MEFDLKSIVLFFSVILTSLSAGLFYAWVISVIPGTKRLTDQAYLETMQSINREILNFGFFVIFFGALILLVLSCFLQYRGGANTVFYFTLSATIVYAIGTMGVTMFGNVPLNNMVEAMDLTSFSAEDYRNARMNYEDQWNNLNLMRTIAAIISFVLVLVALIKT